MSKDGEQGIAAGLPKGREFFDLCWRLEDKCESQTDQKLLSLGEKAPKCLTNLGTMLSLLYRAAVCGFGCRGGDHAVERLVAKAVTTASASIRLSRFGYYDDALALSRSVGEIANLLLLFRKETASFENWRTLAATARKKAFSPVKVRIRLEKLAVRTLVDQERYTELSELATHPMPGRSPQSYFPLLTSIVGGGIFQPAGLLTSLNELALATALVGVPAALLLEFDEDKKRRFKEAAVELIYTVGGVQVVDPEKIAAIIAGS